MHIFLPSSQWLNVMIQEFNDLNNYYQWKKYQNGIKLTDWIRWEFTEQCWFLMTISVLPSIPFSVVCFSFLFTPHYWAIERSFPLWIQFQFLNCEFSALWLTLLRFLCRLSIFKAANSDWRLSLFSFKFSLLNFRASFFIFLFSSENCRILIVRL